MMKMRKEEAISYFKVLLLHLQSWNSSTRIAPTLQAKIPLGIIDQFLAGAKDFACHLCIETDN
jgi:hypothetical protein